MHPEMTEEQVLEDINRIYPNMKVTEIVGVSILDNGDYIHVAAHTPLTQAEGRSFWNHRYFQFTIARWDFGKCIYDDSNVTDANHFKTAEETRQKAINYFGHVLKKL